MTAELADPSDLDSDGSADRNEVVLAGRLSGAPERRELPSGDLLVSFRLVVRRPPPRKAPKAGVPRPPTIDTIDCVTWSADVRRAVKSWAKDDVVEVTGALRRRFWRAGAGPVSRTEVEVSQARRLARAAAPP